MSVFCVETLGRTSHKSNPKEMEGPSQFCEKTGRTSNFEAELFELKGHYPSFRSIHMAFDSQVTSLLRCNLYMYEVIPQVNQKYRYFYL